MALRQDQHKQDLLIKPSKSAKTATTMADLLAATGYHIPSLKPGQEVNGKVVAVSPTEILVDIGAKSEGIIFGRELSSVIDLARTLSVGDMLDAVVLYPENDAGQVVLSLRKHSAEKRWIELEEKENDNEDIDVSVIEANRGGLICEWMGIRGFLPASQLATPDTSSGSINDGQDQTTTKLDELIGRTLMVRVIEVDKTTNRLILSQKAPDKENLEKIRKLLGKVKIGDKFDGVVSAVLPFGLFVEIGVEGAKGTKGAKGTNEEKDQDSAQPSKLEGLVHISEISWEKIDDVSNHFKVGASVGVAVIGKDEESGRLSLSIKHLAEDPFVAASAKYSKDEEVAGTISKVTPYGVFVTLENGVEGLVHVSKIPQNESWQVGQEVDCTIESVDAAARRISLVPVVREKPILYR